MSLSSADILNQSYQRKQKSRSGFSIRTFAKCLKVSPSFASAMISGKKAIPMDRVQEIAEVLEMDLMELNDLKQTLAMEALQKQGVSFGLQSSSEEKAVRKYKNIAKSQFRILGNWYNIAIMDLTTCDHFQNEPAWIAAQLGISNYQVEQALRQLISHGLLVETPTGYIKAEDKIRMSFDESHEDIRKYHTQMIEKAKTEMQTRTSKADFLKREITGITIATNPRNIEKARLKLVEALHEVAEILSEGEVTELYQINAQLFSLLKN